MTDNIYTKNLTVGYGSPLISDISFHVKGGEIMTLIGPNGSGKSTILKTLAGELAKLGGTVFLEGTNTDEISGKERAKKQAVLLTERIKADMMTCREVVETGRYPYTGHFGLLSDKDKEAVEKAISLVNIEDFADRDFSAISDGQRQRVMLARAICQEPRVLILDEPTSYLDIHHKILFVETLRKLVDEQKIAAVVSLHEIDFAKQISDYTVCIKDNAVRYMGKPEDIFSKEVICELFDLTSEQYLRYFK